MEIFSGYSAFLRSHLDKIRDGSDIERDQFRSGGIELSSRNKIA
jgi:hypothetical protein